MHGDIKRSQLGVFGEKLVRNFYQKKGCQVVDTLSTFDNSKDFLVSGKSVEVKTQQAFHLENAFTVKPDQVNKCKSVDMLIFVETPYQNNRCINLWLATNTNFRSKTTRDGRQMQLLDKKNMILLESITDSNLVSEAIELSSTSWKGANPKRLQNKT